VPPSLFELLPIETTNQVPSLVGNANNNLVVLMLANTCVEEKKKKQKEGPYDNIRGLPLLFLNLVLCVCVCSSCNLQTS